MSANWIGDAGQLAAPVKETTWRYHVRDKSGVTWGKFHTRAKAKEFAAVHRPPMTVVDTSRVSRIDEGANQ